MTCKAFLPANNAKKIVKRLKEQFLLKTELKNEISRINAAEKELKDKLLEIKLDK